VDPRTGLYDVESRKLFTLPGLELRPLGRPARSQSLYLIPAQILPPNIEVKFHGASVARILCKLSMKWLCVTYSDQHKFRKKSKYYKNH
jgi:hypothetical protein